MPAAPLLIGAVAAGGGAAAAGVTVFGLGVAASAVLIGVGTAALGFVQQALTPKPKLPSFGGFDVAVATRTTFIRQAVTERRVPVGEVVLSGILNEYEATNDNGDHHLVVTLGDAPLAPWEDIGIVLLDNVPIFPSQIGVDGWVTTGKFKNKVRIKKHLGGPDQVADADLIAAVSRLDESFRGRGVAYCYLHVKWDNDAFPNGLPKPLFVCKTNKWYDVRDESSAAEPVFTTNPALVTNGYFTEPTVCLGYEDEDVSRDATVAAANLAEEFVETAAVAHMIVAVDVANDLLDLATSGPAAPIRFETGDRVEVECDGTHPGGLAAETSYYVRVERLIGDAYETTVDGYDTLSNDVKNKAIVQAMREVGALDSLRSSTTTTINPAISLHPTYADAMAGTDKIAISSAGSGNMGVVKTGEPRYSCSGALETGRVPQDNILDLLSAMAGRLVDTGGEFRMLGGSYVSPSMDLYMSDLMGPMVVRWAIPTRERFNCVKGLYAPLITVGEATDYPPVIDGDYVEADGGRKVFLDYDQPFTSRTATAQRNGKIVLGRARGEISIDFPMTLKGMRAIPGTVVRVWNARRGWAPLICEVIDQEDAFYGDEEPKVRGCTLKLQQTASTIYTFAPDSQETIKSPRPVGSAGNPLNVAPPTNLALASGTDVLDLRKDGSVWSRIEVAWTAPSDRFVTGGGSIEIRYRKDSTGVWQPVQFVGGAVTKTYILDVQDGVAYSVAARSINTLGVASDTSSDPADWSAIVTGHVVLGKSQPASNATNFSAQQTSLGTVSFGWARNSDLDRGGTTIKRTPRGAPQAWDDATLVTEEEAGTEKTSAAVPPGDWRFLAKHVDTSGNESTVAATFDKVVVNTHDVVAVLANAPRWPGWTKGLVRHDVSGTLIPRSGTLAADASDAELWNRMAHNPVAAAEYEGPEIDLGFDAEGVRVWAEIAAALGPGETGIVDLTLSVDYRDEAGDYDGFEPWTVGEIDFRRLKSKIALDTSRGVAAISAFVLTADVPEHESHHPNVVIAIGGTTVAFDRTFHALPGIDVSAAIGVGDAPRIVNWKDLTATSVKVFVFDKDGSDVGGTATVTATGP